MTAKMKRNHNKKMDVGTFRPVGPAVLDLRKQQRIERESASFYDSTIDKEIHNFSSKQVVDLRKQQQSEAEIDSQRISFSQQSVDPALNIEDLEAADSFREFDHLKERESFSKREDWRQGEDPRFQPRIPSTSIAPDQGVTRATLPPQRASAPKPRPQTIAWGQDRVLGSRQEDRTTPTVKRSLAAIMEEREEQKRLQKLEEQKKLEIQAELERQRKELAMRRAKDKAQAKAFLRTLVKSRTKKEKKAAASGIPLGKEPVLDDPSIQANAQEIEEARRRLQKIDKATSFKTDSKKFFKEYEEHVQQKKIKTKAEIVAKIRDLEVLLEEDKKPVKKKPLVEELPKVLVEPEVSVASVPVEPVESKPVAQVIQPTKLTKPNKPSRSTQSVPDPEAARIAQAAKNAREIRYTEAEKFFQSLKKIEKTDDLARKERLIRSVKSPARLKPAPQRAPQIAKAKAPKISIGKIFKNALVGCWDKVKDGKELMVEIVGEVMTPRMKKAFAYSSVTTVLVIAIPVALVAYRGLKEKNVIEDLGIAGYGNLKEAQASMSTADINTASKNFDLAYKNFLEARGKLDEVGGNTTKILDFVPGISKVESGRQLATAGENVALAGKEMTAVAELLMSQKENLDLGIEAEATGSSAINDDMDLTDMVLSLEERLKAAQNHLTAANTAAQEIDENDFPDSEKEKIVMLKETLPVINQTLDSFFEYTDVFLEILGHNGPRQYLIVFENNHEMRATGGFIGTYAVVKVKNGKIEDLKVDGIYNPDGQLKEKIIPPEPIQKMSAAWSMHDANWWPDFPTSAEKIGWFYEKTGGPTVDGVIALTPKTIRDLLEITGPIEVPGYQDLSENGQDEFVVDSENFMEIIQYQVEVAYDKEENRPKQVLADMTPILISKVLASSPEDWPRILGVLSNSLKERHLFMYSFNEDIQHLVGEMGWSGELLKTNKDYLSVVNTNISGMKTDGVIEQHITHKAEIQDDGSIVVNLVVERKHNGGDAEHEWHNAVNVDWMRVYVPEGSELISATGFTREFVDPPLDYEKLGFKTDFQVEQMEGSYVLDEESATRMYQESGKTVFANWVYTSPGETSTVTLKYLLPFRLDLKNAQKPADAYSLLVQKQAGDENTELKAELTGLEDYEYIYKYPEDLKTTKAGWYVEQALKQDVFFALLVKED